MNEGDEGTALGTYFRAISGMNGLMFLMLGLTILNYGSRLETLIMSTKTVHGNITMLTDVAT